MGQFEQPKGDAEEFGLLLEKGSDLTPCADEAIAELKEDGTLADLQEKWLSTTVDVPVLE